MAQTFITQKTQQLVFYTSHYLAGKLSQAELHIFIWDTLEEWSTTADRQLPLEVKEQVFWYLLFQLEYWPVEQVLNDNDIKSQLQRCITFLTGTGQYPADCLGVRP